MVVLHLVLGTSGRDCSWNDSPKLVCNVLLVTLNAILAQALGKGNTSENVVEFGRYVDGWRIASGTLGVIRIMIHIYSFLDPVMEQFCI